MATMPIGAIAIGSRAKNAAAENPLAPGAWKILAYAFAIVMLLAQTRR
jgi:hypothetical protein